MRRCKASAINGEVEVKIPLLDQRIVAIVTNEGIEALGLVPGGAVDALI